jgi:hypothetical protein
MRVQPSGRALLFVAITPFFDLFRIKCRILSNVSPEPSNSVEVELQVISKLPRLAARTLIFVYRVSLSAFAGRWCRHAPTCSEFADEAIARHGLWAGGWMSLARICRCRPGGTDGFDPPPLIPPAGASALTPWRYGKWRGPLICEAVDAPQERAISSIAKP